MSQPVYLDSSAIVKLYVREAGSAEALQWLADAGPVACSVLGYVEVRAALAAAARSQRLKPDEHLAALESFKSDWAGYSTVATDATLLERAAELAEGFGLRGYDSLHLASAERIRRALPATCFISFDLALNGAAKLLGFVVPPFVQA